jgi:hypothetical protein
MTIPDAVLNLPKLEKIDLRWNRIEEKSAQMQALEARGCLVYI